MQQEATARASFRMTFDEQPCYHPKATPLIILGEVNTVGIFSRSAADNQSKPSAQRTTDYGKYSDYEYLYRSAWEQVRENFVL